MSDQPKQDPRYSELAKQYEKQPPVQVETLGYATGTRGEKRRKYGQFAAGMAAPYLYTTAVIASVSSFGGTPQIWQAVLWLAVAAFVVGVVYIHTMTSWKAFTPGVVTGILVVPLVLAGACAMLVIVK
jgi:hypothetical protein